MPKIDENRSLFDQTHDWPEAGEEWSKGWGGAKMQWYGCILPRISAFVPADTILEIAPEYGRWTALLKSLCKASYYRGLVRKLHQYLPRTIRRLFSYLVPRQRWQVMEMVTDSSVDFIFSFDSLVHAEDAVLRAYAAEFAKKLRPKEAAFIHHSNLGEYIRRIEVQSQLSRVPRLYRLFEKLGVCDNLATHGGREA